MKIQNTKKGVSIYFALLIMTLLLALALGISTLLFGQIRMMGGMENSVLAFYAADTGIDEVLVNPDSPSSDCSENQLCCLENGACYYITIINGGQTGCDASNYCIKSVGTYKETKRAIEISY